jgi:hypothetical protein
MAPAGEPAWQAERMAEVSAPRPPLPGFTERDMAELDRILAASGAPVPARSTGTTVTPAAASQADTVT